MRKHRFIKFCTCIFFLVLIFSIGCSNTTHSSANTKFTKDENRAINAVIRDVGNSTLKDMEFKIRTDPKHTTSYFVMAIADENEEEPAVWWVDASSVFYVNDTAKEYNKSIPQRVAGEFDLNVRYIYQLFE